MVEAAEGIMVLILVVRQLGMELIIGSPTTAPSLNDKYGAGASG
jgi:hypothetical protein